MHKIKLIIIAIGINACINIYSMHATERIPNDVMKIIQSSNTNKEELLRVLDYFKDDSEKFKAACFLIKNMYGKYYYDSNKIQDFYKTVTEFINNTPNKNNKICQKFYDDCIDSYNYILDGCDKIYDLDNIKADYLISEINTAFESWKNSWSHHISFSLFCEYVLPYRIGEEPLSNWRSKYHTLYSKVANNLQGMQDNKFHKLGLYNELCKNIPLSLYIPKQPVIDFSLEMLPDLFMGSCKSIAYLNVAQLRALGIPATVDYIPQWANRSMGHSWGVIFMNDSTSIPFGRGEQLGIHFNARPERKIPKVFRETFKNNEYMSEITDESDEFIPELFKNRNIIDVTNVYTSTSNVEVNLFAKNSVRSRKWIFLCVFDNEDWVPIWFGKNENGKVIFSNVGRGVAYLPVIYDKDGQYISASNPFIISNNGIVKEIVANINETQDVLLKRKYNYTPRVDLAHKQIIGGSFYLSNNINFEDSLFVGSIQDYGINAYCSLPIDNKRLFKYVKYCSSLDNMSQTAELFFYDNKGELINIINTHSFKNDTKGQENAMFDGNVLTSCNMSRITGKWIIVEFEKETAVSEIRVIPSTDGNFIEKDDKYELYYWDDGWRLLLEKVADDYGYLEIEQIPLGGLFLLHDVTKGTEERIFTIEDGDQIWW